MTSLTPKQLEVLQALSSGQSVTSAADAAAIHRTTIHHWCRTIPEFRAELHAARQARVDAIRDQIHDLASPSLALLQRAIEDETAPAPLRHRAALAILKVAIQPEKLPGMKDAAFDTLLDAAYATGITDAHAGSEPNEIHHNSSPSAVDSVNQPAHARTPRNATCPCGSRLKFKRCCGRNAPPVLFHTASPQTAE